MSTSIHTRRQDDVCIIEFRGRLTIGEGDLQLREAIEEALAGGCKRIVLDLSGANSVDSSGLGELVRGTTIARRAGAKIVLAGVKDKILDVLEMTSLISIFDRYDSPDNALMEIGNL